MVINLEVLLFTFLFISFTNAIFFLVFFLQVTIYFYLFLTFLFNFHSAGFVMAPSETAKSVDIGFLEL